MTNDLLKRNREGIRLLQIVQQIARPDHYLCVRIRRRIVGYPDVKLVEADKSGRHPGEERLSVDAPDHGLDVLGHAIAGIPIGVRRISQSSPVENEEELFSGPPRDWRGNDPVL